MSAINHSLPDGHASRQIRLALGVGLLVFYDLGVIIGAGIYVLVGTVVGTAGLTAPLSLVVAGLMAGLTGLYYAELGIGIPESVEAAARVKWAFGSDRLPQAIGLAAAVLASMGPWQSQCCEPATGDQFSAPRWVPPTAAIASLMLVVAQFFS